jgi:hypothetical protein
VLRDGKPMTSAHTDRKVMKMWKQIDGFQNYEISDKGEVRNIQSGKILKPWVGVGGYAYVNPTNGHGKPMPKRLHRLVAKAFVPGYFEGADVNHKDENKHNNRADNLEWCDRQYNINYGTGKWRREKFNARPVEQLTMDGKHIAYHENASQAARAVGCDPSTIRAVCNGKHGAKNCQTAKGYRWRYKEETDN